MVSDGIVEFGREEIVAAGGCEIFVYEITDKGDSGGEI